MRGRKPNVLVNDIREEFCDAWFSRDELKIWPLWVDDIVSGVARLDWYGEREQQIPLSTSSIIQCFIHLDEISTKSVAHLLQLGDRMARKYSAACRLCYPFFKRELEKPRSERLVYPQVSIVSVEHGLKLGYDR